jgi:hypothetical protein
MPQRQSAFFQHRGLLKCFVRRKTLLSSTRLIAAKLFASPCHKSFRPNVTVSGYLLLFTNNGSGVFGSNATLAVNNDPEFVVAADVNGDHRPGNLFFRLKQ